MVVWGREAVHQLGGGGSRPAQFYMLSEKGFLIEIKTGSREAQPEPAHEPWACRRQALWEGHTVGEGVSHCGGPILRGLDGTVGSDYSICMPLQSNPRGCGVGVTLGFCELPRQQLATSGASLTREHQSYMKPLQQKRAVLRSTNNMYDGCTRNVGSVSLVAFFVSTCGHCTLHCRQTPQPQL